MKFTVLRAFLLAGVRQEIGAEIDLTDRDLIGGLTTAGKVAPVGDAPQPPDTGPMTTQNVGGLVAGRAKNKAKD